MLSTRIVSFLEKIDDYIHVFIAFVLLITSFAVVIHSIIKGINKYIKTKDLIESSVIILHELLLAMIILEVLWLIYDYLKTKNISVEPFLIIGIISSVRKILILSAKPIENITPASMDLYIKEIATNTIVIFVIIIGLYLVRKSKKRES
jgi:uncharacterized membrane protein (DUF373 family)